MAWVTPWLEGATGLKAGDSWWTFCENSEIFIYNLWQGFENWKIIVLPLKIMSFCYCMKTYVKLWTVRLLTTWWAWNSGYWWRSKNPMYETQWCNLGFQHVYWLGNWKQYTVTSIKSCCFYRLEAQLSWRRSINQSKQKFLIV